MSYVSEAINAQAEGINAATAVQRSSAGAKAPGQTIKTFSGMQSFAATVTSVALYTPAAGKSFYLTDFNISTDVGNSNNSGQGTNLDVQIITGTTASILARGSMHSLAPFSMNAIESQPPATGNVPMSIVISSAATVGHVWFNVFGWEE